MDGETAETRAGTMGFFCPKGNCGGKVPFSYCEDYCVDRCLDLPTIYSFGEEREIRRERFSVTDLTNPHQQVYLKRNNPVYVNPLDMVWMAFGSGVHAALELGYKRIKNKDGYIAERGVTMDFDLPNGKITLSGRPDIVMMGESKIQDYKTSGWKSVPLLKRKLKDGWMGDDKFIQPNVYRAVWYPEIENLELVILSKDWTKWAAGKEGVEKLEVIPVPVGPADEVIDWVKIRLSAYLEVEKNGGVGVKCYPADTWDGRRCAEYCQVNYLCPQYQGARGV